MPDFNDYEEGDNMVSLVNSVPIDFEPLPSIEDNFQATAKWYKALASCATTLFASECQLQEAKYDLEDAQAKIRRDHPGKELGVNVDDREAKISIMTSVQISQVRAATAHVMRDKGALEATQIQCRLCDKTLEHIKLSLGSVVLEVNDARS